MDKFKQGDRVKRNPAWYKKHWQGDVDEVDFNCVWTVDYTKGVEVWFKDHSYLEDYKLILVEEKKEPKRKDPKIFKKITTKNGFTLAEVRRIRKEIRDILADENALVYAGAEDAGYICGMFYWEDTPQGYLYWMELDARTGCPTAIKLLQP